MCDVITLAQQQGLWSHICDAVRQQNVNNYAHILDQVARLPVKRSRATRILGCYVSRQSQPWCVRLQFDQEPEQLRQTLLHEIAHVLDHLVNFSGQPYRGAHCSGWQVWATALGISTCRTGHSEVVARQYRQRQKLVAVCSGCGESIYRLRRLDRNRSYIHASCGSLLRPI
ncbi:MAG: hypothetical protein U9R29_07585 [Thermodesulfobacteriota bacterium]|nr:hypothetical protein [Thermodesulfobacteriota bacterium]